MELPEPVEWMLHSCVLLGFLPSDKSLPAAKLAEFHELPAAYLAKNMQALAGAGIVDTTVGRTGGYRLAKSPEQITLLEVVEAVSGSGPSFRCVEIRRQGPCSGAPTSYKSACNIAKAMHRADAAWRTELRKQTIADMMQGLERDVAPEQRARYQRWLEEACR